MKSISFFTEEINKMTLSSNDDKRIQSIDLIETYAHGISKYLVCKKEEIKCNYSKMFNFGYITKEHIKENNPNWPEIADHLYRLLIVGGSGSRKTNFLLKLINHKLDIDKIYLYAKNPYRVKYQLLINKIKSTGLKYLNNS